MRNIRFAFALDDNNFFTSKNFSDADKFQIEQNNDSIEVLLK